MDALDALLRLHHAAGNAAWLRIALDRKQHDADAPRVLLEAPDAAWHALGAPPGARADALGADAGRHADQVRRWIAGGEARTVVGWHEPMYPSLLREAGSPPSLLFVEGQAERLWWPQIAVVGSRAPTPGGRDRAARWARAFAEAGYVVTSGLASGVDAAAHQACLQAPGTIAVTGTGPDRCFPAQHRDLHAAITAQGCVVTEHPPGTAARAEHFPSRNRIIAGLSLATVVIEAAQRSGALITARLAAEAGREAFALPGAPENPKARGCHRLIRDGATLVDDPAQVLEAIASLAGEVPGQLRGRLPPGSSGSVRGIPAAADVMGDLFSPPPGGLTDAPSGAEATVARAIGHEGACFDELLARSGLTSATLAPILLAMELEGRLTQQHGVYLPCGSAPPTRAGHQRRR